MTFSGPPPRVLLLRAGALGDILLLRRAVGSLRAAGVGVTLMAPREPGTVLVGPGAGEVDRLLDWHSPAVTRLLAGDSCGEALGLDGIDAAACFTNDSDVVALLERVIPAVIPCAPLPPRGWHAADWYASAVMPWVRLIDEAPPCEATRAEQDQAAEWRRQLGDGYVAIHPGSGSPGKNWPAEAFAHLVRAVTPNRPWLLILGPAEEGSGERLRRLPGAVVAESLSARVVGCLLSHAAVYVGNDSGMSHLAAAWGAPSVVLFGPSDPQQWAPRGADVVVLRSSTRAMGDLSVETVVDEVRKRRGAATSLSCGLPCG